ncbi:response regulator transcription factor [Staphylococcus haemolyticus]|uniref:response regulator transcription factor n=1 Tax=Staphylococcus haemolyticus TaxID=1283 RepID=UPI00069E0416|nr:response regulator transcription factor [Staphylococcus haemolyticus]MCC2094487.1 response regulator transcription factor [Staphylococcus haemolyticus]
MEGFHILLVEDDETIAKNLKQILQQKGAQVTLDRTGDSVFNVLNDVHIIIMDIMLPNNDGLCITDEIRSISTIPIIYLSARVDIDSKVKGLNNGDDYLTKPFNPRELISRINNLLTIHYADKEAQFYEFKVNAKDKIIKSNDGNQLSLTKTERRLFFYMYENRDLILTKDQIIDYVWQFESASENTLNAYVKKLRTKLLDSGTIIETIYGIGYRLNGG